MNESERMERYIDLMLDITLSLYENDTINVENKIKYYEKTIEHIARCLYGAKNNLSIPELSNIGTKVDVVKETEIDVH